MVLGVMLGVAELCFAKGYPNVGAFVKPRLCLECFFDEDFNCMNPKRYVHTGIEPNCVVTIVFVYVPREC